MNSGRKCAVILSGGGARGAYQVGVLKALRRRGVEPEIICGTSVGAFNGAMLASGKSLEEIESVWLNLEKKDVFDFRFDPRRLLTLNPAVPFDFAMGAGQSLYRMLEGIVGNQGTWWQGVDLDAILIDSSPLRELIRRHVDLERVRHGSKQLFVALTRLRPVGESPLSVVSSQSLDYAHIEGSCALPLIFSPVETEEGAYCDGGVVMNTPLKLAIDAGAEVIYVVDLTPPPETYRDATMPLAYQAMSAGFSMALQRDLAVARDRNAEFLAALLDGRLKDGCLEVVKMTETAGELTRVRSRYRYVHILEIQPRPDSRGLAAFLDFQPEQAVRLIREGEEEGEAMLQSYETRQVELEDGTFEITLRHQ